MAKKEFNHFTQLIWKQTAKVGFGMATNRQVNRFHVVAVYDPVGNYDGKINKKWQLAKLNYNKNVIFVSIR